MSSSRKSKPVAVQSVPPTPDWIVDALTAAPPILTIREAAALTRVSDRQLRRFIVAGQIAALKTSASGPGRVLFARAEIGRFLQSMADAQLQTMGAA
jgi:excisionase family DNA binding protein